MKEKRKWSKKIVQELYDRHHGNYKMMALDAGVPYNTLTSATRRYGFKPVKQDYKTDDYHRTVQLLAIMNDTMISKEVSLSRERVRQIRNEHGISSPLKSERCSLVWNEDKLATLCKLKIEDYTRTEIAEILNVPRFQLDKKCKEIGIDLRQCWSSYKYSKKLLFQLYEEHNGVIMHIAQIYVDNGTFTNTNAARSTFYRIYKKIGLTGQGEQFIKGHDGNPPKYTYEIIKPLWDKYKGNMYAISKELKTNPGSMWHACIRLGLHTPEKNPK